MYTDGVDIFHVADGDTVPSAVAHDLVLDFLPACHAAFDQHLPDHAVLETLDDNLDELFLVFRDTAAGSAQRIRGTDNQRIADGVGKCDGRRYILDDSALGNRLAELLHGFLEKLPVFRLLDGLNRGTEQLHAVLFKRPIFRQLHG